MKMWRQEEMVPVHITPHGLSAALGADDARKATTQVTAAIRNYTALVFEDFDDNAPWFNCDSIQMSAVKTKSESILSRLELACETWHTSLSLEDHYAQGLKAKGELCVPACVAEALGHADELYEAALLAAGIPPLVTDQLVKMAAKHQALALGLATQADAMGSVEVFTPSNSQPLSRVATGGRNLMEESEANGQHAYTGMELLGESHGHQPHSTQTPAATAAEESDHREGSDASDSTSVGTGTFFTSEAAFELYDRLGGWDVLSASVQHMYHKLFNDPRTSLFFQHSDHAKLMRHMTCFIGSALSGKILYSPRKIWHLHKRHMQEGMTMEHVDIMTGHLRVVLVDLGLTDDAVADAVNCLQEMRWVFSDPNSFNDPADIEARYQARHATFNPPRGGGCPVGMGSASPPRGPSPSRNHSLSQPSPPASLNPGLVPQTTTSSPPPQPEAAATAPSTAPTKGGCPYAKQAKV